VYRYRTFNQHLKEHFGEKVYRVPIDAGFTCPNRDGVRAFGGCTFCDDRGSGAPTIDLKLSIQQQLNTQIAHIRKKFKAKKFLAYFQAFTNTYAPEAVLKELYETALNVPDVVGLCIGTRPDCLPDNILELLAEFQKKTFLWLEVGLQSAFDETLEKINRGHTAAEFFDCIKRAQKYNLNIATHLIFGLPGETKDQMLESVRQISSIGLKGIKIHQLCIYKGTPLEQEYKQGQISVFEEDEYIELVGRALELLPSDMIIMRLLAEGRKEEIIAPQWCFEKTRLSVVLEQYLEVKDVRQGSKYRTLQHHSRVIEV
jgi:radical SAM protein (TIGR01212 family)